MPDCDSRAFAWSSSLPFDSHLGHHQAEMPLNTLFKFAEPPLRLADRLLGCLCLKFNRRHAISPLEAGIAYPDLVGVRPGR